MTYGLVIFLFAVILSGCSSRSVSERVMEKAIESQTGGDVNVDTKGEGITIKTEEGESQYSAGGGAKVPENFPKELIVSDDAKIIISSSSENVNTVAYVTGGEQGEIFEKYKNTLAELGWKKELEIDTGNGKMASFSKGVEKATVTIGENSDNEISGKSMVQITYVKE